MTAPLPRQLTEDRVIVEQAEGLTRSPDPQGYRPGFGLPDVLHLTAGTAARVLSHSPPPAKHHELVPGDAGPNHKEK